jgi:hypothetical protein
VSWWSSRPLIPDSSMDLEPNLGVELGNFAKLALVMSKIDLYLSTIFNRNNWITYLATGLSFPRNYRNCSRLIPAPSAAGFDPDTDHPVSTVSKSFCCRCAKNIVVISMLIKTIFGMPSDRHSIFFISSLSLCCLHHHDDAFHLSMQAFPAYYRTTRV